MKNGHVIELWTAPYQYKIYLISNEIVENAEYQINRLYQAKSYATLNDFYYLLGMDPVEDGNCVGWMDIEGLGPNRIEFYHDVMTVYQDTSPIDNDVECYVTKICFLTKPIRFTKHDYISP